MNRAAKSLAITLGLTAFAPAAQAQISSITNPANPIGMMLYSTTSASSTENINPAALITTSIVNMAIAQHNGTIQFKPAMKAILDTYTVKQFKADASITSDKCRDRTWYQIKASDGDNIFARHNGESRQQKSILDPERSLWSWSPESSLGKTFKIGHDMAQEFSECTRKAATRELSGDLKIPYVDDGKTYQRVGAFLGWFGGRYEPQIR